MKVISFFIDKLNTGPVRTVVIKKNILGSLFIKGLSILVSLLLVPLTLSMLDSEKYGIWITLFSIVTWFNMMDVGLGNGFRNKFAEAVALDKKENAKSYVTTLYASTMAITFSFLLIFAIIHPFLNWYKILNIPEDFNENISLIVLIVFSLFSLQLILKNITTILLSLQQTAKSNALHFIANLLSLFVIVVLGKLGNANLMTISICFMLSPIIVNSAATIFLFRGELKDYLPHKLKIEKVHFSDMMNLGIKFFFIQVTTIVMFSSGNFIIAQLFGPKEVTPYNISYRLFVSTMSVFTILIAPFWSAYTEAITKNDFNWIKKVLKTLNKMWMLFSLGVVFLLLASPLIFKLWIGDKVQIPFILSLSFAFYIILLSWSGMFSQFLNGVGKIKIQLYVAIFQCLSNIPLAIILAKYLNWGLSGVIMATNFNLLLSAIILPIQVYKIANQNSLGLWNK